MAGKPIRKKTKRKFRALRRIPLGWRIAAATTAVAINAEAAHLPLHAPEPQRPARVRTMSAEELAFRQAPFRATRTSLPDQIPVDAEPAQREDRTRRDREEHVHPSGVKVHGNGGKGRKLDFTKSKKPKRLNTPRMSRGVSRRNVPRMK